MQRSLANQPGVWDGLGINCTAPPPHSVGDPPQAPRRRPLDPIVGMGWVLYRPSSRSSGAVERIFIRLLLSPPPRRVPGCRAKPWSMCCRVAPRDNIARNKPPSLRRQCCCYSRRQRRSSSWVRLSSSSVGWSVRPKALTHCEQCSVNWREEMASSGGSVRPETPFEPLLNQSDEGDWRHCRDCCDCFLSGVWLV